MIPFDEADYESEVNEYIAGIECGAIVAGRLVRLAIKRHLIDLQHAGDRGFYFDTESANQAIWFIETCCVHIKDSESANRGDRLILSPSQKFITWCIFGWKKKSNGMRRFSHAWLEFARKWGKSLYAAAVTLLLMSGDDPLTHEGQFWSAATKKDQAKLVHNQAQAMVKGSPSLQRHLQVFKSAIVNTTTNGSFQAIGSDSDTTDGLEPDVVIKDEVHGWRKRHRWLMEVLDSGSDTRPQPLLISITTAGDTESEIWSEERDYCVRILESVLSGNVVDDTRFAFIACIDYPNEFGCIECGASPEGCEWCEGGMVPPDNPLDPDVMIKANPNLGITIPHDKVHEWINEARQNPVKMNKHLRYRCNVRVSTVQKAIDPVRWARCKGELTIEPGATCHGAFDLGRSNDFSAWAQVFPIDTDDGRRYEVLSRSYTSEKRAEQLHGEEFDRWIRDGLLIVHDGDQVSFPAIREDIVTQSEKYSTRTWAFDPTFAQETSQILINDHGYDCSKFVQSYGWYNECIRELLRLIGKGPDWFRHDGCPVLAWQANNVQIKKDHRDLWMFDKIGSDGKIDAMVALAMALSECMYHEREWKSYYETQSEVEFA